MRHESLKRFVLAAGLTMLLGFTAFILISQSQAARNFIWGEQSEGAVQQLVIKAQTGDHIFTYDLADDPDEQSRGLMHRREIADDYGMLFLYEKADERFMWMKNTYISLDMLFIDDAGKILKIARKTQPHSEDVISSGQPAIAVLEIKGGEARNRGIFEGDIVEW